MIAERNMLSWHYREGEGWRGRVAMYRMPANYEQKKGM